jgi:hypothetical protein
MAETVIGAWEDAEDYKRFEVAITADYDAQSAVEREWCLLWRLRRATTIETGLFEIQADHLSSFRKTHQISPARVRSFMRFSMQTPIGKPRRTVSRTQPRRARLQD